MSHPVNDNYMEHMLERFDELKDGNARMALLTEMRWNGFDQQADELVASWYLERLDWLEEHGVDESDVLVEHTDQNYYNMEFYYDINESGAPGCDYQITNVKRYLPNYLNVSYWVETDKKSVLT